MLISVRMKVLEARFHPRSKAHAGSVVIGRVIRQNDRVFIEPADVSERAVRPFDLQALLRKLRLLVDTNTPAAFDLLTSFRSDFWSFTETAESREGNGPQ